MTDTADKLATAALAKADEKVQDALDDLIAAMRDEATRLEGFLPQHYALGKEAMRSVQRIREKRDSLFDRRLEQARVINTVYPGQGGRPDGIESNRGVSELQAAIDADREQKPWLDEYK